MTTDSLRKHRALALTFVSSRPVLVSSLVLFGLSAALYGLTMAPGLTWKNEGGDGGDFLSAAHTWGIPHPTGYPTYIVLLRSFSELVWFGDEASNGNLFSALAGALSVPFFFLASRKLLLRLPLAETRGWFLPNATAFVTALGYATSNLLWSQSTVTEVYALNALFVCIFLWVGLIARSRIERGDRALGLRVGLAVLLGVAFGNHVTVSFVAVPFGIWVYWPLAQRYGRSLLREWQPLAGLVAGLSIYAYSAIASNQDPALNWFFPHTFSGFRSMVSASIYQPYVFGLPADHLLDRIAAAFDIWLTQYTALGALLGVGGILYLWGRLRGLAIAGAAAFLSLGVYSIAYNTFDSYVFLIPAFAVFGLWVSAGLLNIAISLLAFAEKQRSGWLSRNSKAIAPAVLAAALIGVPVWSAVFNYDGIDISDDTEAIDYVDSAFETAGPGSLVVASNIPTFSLWYRSLVESPEQDVMVVAAFLLEFNWYWDHLQRQFPDRMPQDVQGGVNQRMRSIVRHNEGIRVFLTHENAAYSSLFELSPAGPLWLVTG